MTELIKQALEWLGKPRLVEFDYRDAAGLHRGRCYVSFVFAGRGRVKHQLRRFGYTNIRFA